MSIYDKFDTNAVGLRTVSGGNLTYDLATRESHTVDLDPKIHSLDEAMPGAPILGLSNKIGSPKTVTQPIFFMQRKKQLPRFIDLNGSYTTGTTLTFAAADVQKLKVGYHIMNTLTREIMMVSALASSTTVTVDRSVGTVASANSISTDDEIIILGYRGAEADDKFLDFIRQPDVIFNYVAELQKVYGVSQYEKSAGHVSGQDPLAVLRMDKLQEMRLELEWAILFDQRRQRVRSTDSKVVYNTGGIDSFLTDHETDFSGSLTEAKLMSAARSIARHGPNDRWACASPRFMEQLNNVYVGDRRLNTPVPREVGIDIMSVKYSGLNFHFFQHPLFEDASSTHANSLRGHAFILDMDDMALVTMKSDMMGFFKWFMNVQTPGARERQDQLICNFGVKMTRPEHYARWFNVG